MSSVAIGQQAEAFARTALERAGYVVVAQNVRPALSANRRWEIDLIAWDDRILCFVEVRSTKTRAFGGPLATVGFRKQRAVVRAARAYLLQHAELREARMRFDVLGICGEAPAYEHTLVRGAFVAES